jgi:hypothetical protein
VYNEAMNTKTTYAMREVNQMTKATDTVELDEILEDEDTDETETVETITPTMLATELDVNPKVLRAWLRRNFPRPLDQKNTSWSLSQDMIDAATEYFLGDDDDESDEDSE